MTWCPDQRAVLVAAVSGRALAAAARRAGFVPLVADLFGDLDTRALAARVIRIRCSLSRGLPGQLLLDALDRLADGMAPEGVVYGSGFEDRAGVLETIAQRHGLIGNAAATVARIKDPMALADFCAQAGVPHPETRMQAPTGGGWLEKRVGGAGGGHVRSRASRRSARGRYYQRRVDGRPVSALFLADGTRAVVLGFSEQWSDPTPASPFRYGGAVRPAVVPDEIAGVIATGLTKLAAATNLVGLCSADFLLRADGYCLLEINPRPGATLDIYQDRDLFRWHVDACRGHLPDDVLPVMRPAAAAVVYARDALRLPDGFIWPDWAADRQPAEDAVPAGAPLCTVMAEGDSAELARQCVLARGAAILAQAGAGA